MATIKSFTDLQQSKKLAEILPLESADMYYMSKDYKQEHFRIPTIIEPNIFIPTVDVPCWSLASLLIVLDFPSLTQNKEDEWEVCVPNHQSDGYIEVLASNPVDACYELILKLHKQNLI